ncbi:MAG: protein kinase [Proteobacteria bacterium]|nr:protein kinase [Pseudomonadota bacterium]
MAQPMMEQVIGSYELIKPLATGGMSELYLARHRSSGQSVALKLLSEYGGDDNELARSRFFNEIGVIDSIHHPNIVKLNEVGITHSGVPYLAMEYLEGETLEDRLERVKRLSIAEALSIAEVIACATAVVHEKGIAHRDLKPDNIMLVPDAERGGENVKVLDFGIAKSFEPHGKQKRITHSGIIVGTPRFMSPEQCMGQRIDHRSDIYSLGIILYRMLTGAFPTQGGSTNDIINGHLHEEVLPPSTHVPEISPGLDQVLLQSLEKDRSQRFQTMEEFSEAVHAQRAELAATSGRVDQTEQVFSLPREMLTVMPAELSARISAKRGTIAWLFVALATLAIATADLYREKLFSMVVGHAAAIPADPDNPSPASFTPDLRLVEPASSAGQPSATARAGDPAGPVDRQAVEPESPLDDKADVEQGQHSSPVGKANKIAADSERPQRSLRKSSPRKRNLAKKRPRKRRASAEKSASKRIKSLQKSRLSTAKKRRSSKSGKSPKQQKRDDYRKPVL